MGEKPLENEKQNLPHCRNSSKIPIENRRNRGKIDIHYHSLSWLGRYFNKKIAGLN
jgi:hypothetical protein